MEYTLFYVLISSLIIFGASQLLATGTIFEPVRNFLGKRFYTNTLAKWGWLLITCPVCTSFWIAMLLGLAYSAYSITGIMILDGILGCATTTFLIALLNRITPQQRQAPCGQCSGNSNDEGHSQTENG